MIIERYLLREMATTFFGVYVVLSLIFLSGTYVRLLTDVAEGRFPTGVLMAMFGYQSLVNLLLALPLSFFLAVLLALGRLYKDSEMVVLSVCGVGPRKVVSAVTMLAGVLALITAFWALQVAPWAQAQAQQLIEEARATPEIEGIVAGRFNEISNNAVVYVEAINEDRTVLENVFIHGWLPRNDPRHPGGSQYIVAERAVQQLDRTTGERWLVLHDGVRYEGKAGDADYRIIEFRRHGLRMEEADVNQVAPTGEAVPTATLWNSNEPRLTAMLQWRISMPLTVLVLGLIAIPLSRSSPRQGRYGRLFAGILIYVIYNNLLTVSRASVARGELDPLIGLWWVHAALLVFAVWALRRQNRLRGPIRPLGAEAA